MWFRRSMLQVRAMETLIKFMEYGMILKPHQSREVIWGTGLDILFPLAIQAAGRCLD